MQIIVFYQTTETQRTFSYLAFMYWALFSRQSRQTKGTPSATLILLLGALSHSRLLKRLLFGIFFRISARVVATEGTAFCDAEAGGQRGKEGVLSVLFFTSFMFSEKGLLRYVTLSTYFGSILKVVPPYETPLILQDEAVVTVHFSGCQNTPLRAKTNNVSPSFNNSADLGRSSLVPTVLKMDQKRNISHHKKTMGALGATGI